jgi:hypothetical protein
MKGDRTVDIETRVRILGLLCGMKLAKTTEETIAIVANLFATVLPLAAKDGNGVLTEQSFLGVLPKATAKAIAS